MKEISMKHDRIIPFQNEKTKMLSQLSDLDES